MGMLETNSLVRGRSARAVLAALLVVAGLAFALSSTLIAAWAAGEGGLATQSADNVVTVESEPATTLEVGSKYVFVSTYGGTSYALTNEVVSNGLIGASVSLAPGENGRATLSFTNAENAANSQWEAVAFNGGNGLDCGGKHLTMKMGTLTSDAGQQSSVAYDDDWKVMGNCLGLVIGDSCFDAWDGNVTPAVAYKVATGDEGGDPQPSANAVRISKKPVTALAADKRYVFISKAGDAKFAMKAEASAPDEWTSVMAASPVAVSAADGKTLATFDDAATAEACIWTASAGENGFQLSCGGQFLANSYSNLKLDESNGASFSHNGTGWGFYEKSVISYVPGSGFRGRDNAASYPPAAAYEVLAADDVEVSTAFGITKADATGGSFDVLVDGEAATEADEGAAVTIAPVPENGYVVDAISVTRDADGAAVELDGSTFTMPGEAVTVSVTFKSLGAVEGTIAVSKDPVTTLVPGKRYVFMANHKNASYALKGTYSSYMGYDVVETASSEGKQIVDFTDADSAGLCIWTAGIGSNGGFTVKNGENYLATSSGSSYYLTLSKSAGCSLAYKSSYWDFGYTYGSYGIGLETDYYSSAVKGFNGKSASYGYPMAAAYEVLAVNGLNTTPFNIGVGEGVTESEGVYSTTGGTFTIKVNGADAKTAMKKQTVVVSATPDAADHYVLDGITVEGAKVAMSGNDATFAMPSADVVVNVAFKQRYAVTFDVNGATNVNGTTKQVDKGGTVAWTSSFKPAVDGKIFVGWAKQGDTELYDFSTPVTEDFTLVAQFKDLVYDIASADDWNTFKSAVEGGIDYAGKTVTLSSDIAVSEGVVDDGSWSSPKVFAGSFDGQGHVITLAVDSAKTSGSVGLFGVLKPASGVTQTISDLRLVGSVSSASYSGGVGALVGKVSGYGAVIVEKVGNDAAITGPSGEQSSAYAGGLIGVSDGGTLQLVHCFNHGSVNGSGACQAGGLVGGTSDEKAVLSVSACYNTGDVVVAGDGEGRSIGGILGNVFTYYSYGMATVNISDSYNAGNVGIAGEPVAAAKSARCGQFIGKSASSALGEKTNLFFDADKVGADKTAGYGDAIAATGVSADVLKALAADGDAKALAGLTATSGSGEVSLFKTNIAGYPALYWESVTEIPVPEPAPPVLVVTEKGDERSYTQDQLAAIAAAKNGDAVAKMQSAKGEAGQVQAAAADGYVKVADLLADAGATWKSGFELEIWSGDELYAPGKKWADTTFDGISAMKWFYPKATSLDVKATEDAEEVPFALTWAVRSANYKGEGQTAADALAAALQNDPETGQVRTLAGAWTDVTGAIQAPGWRSAKGVTKVVVKKTPVDTTALNASIAAGGKAKSGVVKSAKKGADVTWDKKWASAAAFEALDDALASARKAAADEDATQADLDAAQAGLDAAAASFKKAVKAGTKAVAASALSLAVADQVWTGKELRPVPASVKHAGKVLKAGRDYTVTYKNNKGVGTAKATVKAKSKLLSGSKAVSFKVNPKGTKVTSVKAGKGQVAVKWGKQAAQVTGFQLMVADNAKFSGARKVTVTGAAKTSETVKKLAAGKRYYVKVRTFKKVGAATYYSAWSAAKAADKATPKAKAKGAAKAASGTSGLVAGSAGI